MLRPNCKECTERYLGCHDKCESFLKYREEWAKVKELKRKNSELENSFYELTFKGKRRKR